MKPVIYNATQDLNKIYITLKSYKIVNGEIKFFIHKKHIKPFDEFSDLNQITKKFRLE